MPLAARADWVIWAAMAATPAKTNPAAARPAPAASDPAAGSPYPIRASANRPPSTTSAPATTSSAAVSSACLPTTVAPTISARPVSSFCRVCRTIASVLMRPATTGRYPMIWNITIAPSLAPVGAVRSMSSAGLSTAVRRISMRSASVGNLSRTDATTAGTKSNVPMIQSGSWMRSRRIASRTSRPVPVKAFIGLPPPSSRRCPGARRRSGA
jgi:hypothetical protein